MSEVIMYLIISLVVAGNVMTCVVFHWTRSAKETYVVFFSGVTLSSVQVGLTLLVRSICVAIGITNGMGCAAIVGLAMAATTVYIEHEFLISLDLYISLKRMRINDPVLTKNRAVALSVSAWISGIAIAAAGLWFRNPSWQGTYKECTFIGGVHTTAYSLSVLAFMVVIGTAMIVFHILAIGLLKKSMASEFLHQSESGVNSDQFQVSTVEQGQIHNNGEQTNMRMAQYLRDRKHVLQAMTIQITIIVLSCGMAIVINISMLLWTTFNNSNPHDVWRNVAQVPIAFPFVTESVIFVCRNKAMRRAIIRKVCCSA